MGQVSKIRVLVVDDSAFMRMVISDILNSDPNIQVAATARNGKDAIEKVLKNDFDVITLDIEMPIVDGLTALVYIMKNKPTPVVMISALTQKGAEKTITALEYGAVDFICKPSGLISLDISSLRDEIIGKIKNAASAKLKKLKITEPGKVLKVPDQDNKDIVVIGASTGGPPALLELLSQLPSDIGSKILIVQHMPPGFTKSLANRLNDKSMIEVREAVDGDKLLPGVALVAPGDYHMTITQDRVKLNRGAKVNNVRPAVDPLMFSAAETHGSRVVGVILTGMGSDGSDGLLKIKESGGATIAQDEASSVIFGMPKIAIAKGGADKVLPLNEIPQGIITALERNT